MTTTASIAAGLSPYRSAAPRRELPPFADAAPTGLARAAGLVVASTGVLQVLVAAQLLLAAGVTSSDRDTPMSPIVLLWIALLVIGGTGCVAVGAKTARARGWATIASVVSVGCALLLVPALMAFGIVSLLSLFTVPVGVTAIVLAACAIPRALRADAARGAGMDLGV